MTPVVLGGAQEAPLAAEVLFETAPESMGLWGTVDRETGHLVFREQIGFYDARYHLAKPGGAVRTLDLPTDSSMLVTEVVMT